MTSIFIKYRIYIPQLGIVGRTGSGKSSIVQALFRMVEASEGEVLVDGVNLQSLGLNDARSRFENTRMFVFNIVYRLSIIPQDPVLFTGTVRTNVDPTESYNDKDIWSTLESVHMKHAVEHLPMKLDAPVTECKYFRAR